MRLIKWVIAACLLIFCATPSVAASSVAQSNTGTSINPSYTIAFGSNVTAGDTIVVVEEAVGGTPSAPTDNKSNTYINAGGTITVPTTGDNAGVWYAMNVASGSTTVTLNDNGGTGPSRHGIIIDLTGVAASSFDQQPPTAWTTAATGNPTSNVTGNTTAANEMLVGICASTVAVTAGSGYSGLISNVLVFSEFQNVSSTGIYAATFTGSGPFACTIITFKDLVQPGGVHLLPITGAGN